jgi:signal transduction histidine kinase
VTAAHGLAELAVRALLMLQSAPGDALAGQPGWSELSQDGLWMTFFLGFMTQMAVAAVVAQMLRRDKDQLALMLARAQQMLQDKEHQLLNLMGARGTDAQPQLASLAHELRQPLGSIQLNAEYLASGERLSRDEEKQVLQDILRENHRAVAIVQGLRSLFDRSPPVRERIDLAQWLAHWVDRQAPVLLRQCRVQLRLQAQPGLVVRGNEAQLEMVLHNLVNNAVEAMAGQAERQIDIALQREGLLAQLAVMDNGPGVDRSLQDKVFEMSYSTKARGMGLGLWLSRRIVELHQGLLVCVPTPAGACMKISLPLESA